MARKRKFVPSSEWSRDLLWPAVTVLAFDASISATGWALVRFSIRRSPELLARGNLRTEASSKLNQEAILRRSGLIFQQAQGLMIGLSGAYRGLIDRVAIEAAVPGSFGVASQSGLPAAAAVQSAVLGFPEALVNECPISYYHPTHVKKVAAGDGKAEKADVKAEVFKWLCVDPFKVNTDITDAIAVAITDVIDNFDLGVPDDY